MPISSFKSVLHINFANKFIDKIEEEVLLSRDVIGNPKKPNYQRKKSKLTSTMRESLRAPKLPRCDKQTKIIIEVTQACYWTVSINIS